MIEHIICWLLIPLYLLRFVNIYMLAIPVMLYPLIFYCEQFLDKIVFLRFLSLFYKYKKKEKMLLQSVYYVVVLKLYK